MYTTFYKLHTKPFQISSDPAFMWFGEKHQEALATLRYGVLDNKGFLLLTGDVGTGKTTLINALIKSLSDDVICASVPDPNLTKLELFNYIASVFGIPKEFTGKGSFLVGFRQFLMDAHDQNKTVVLIIDEAQLLTQELLEEIRLLSNIEKADKKLINIFFVGQNEFNEILNRHQNRAVRQRLTLNYNIDPLTPDETAQYIGHRLKAAGAENDLFDPSALQEVFMCSGGFPRRINIICDHALLSGYVNEQAVISADIIRECAKELRVPAHVENRDIDGFSDSYPTKPVSGVVPPASRPHQSQPGPGPQPQPMVTASKSGETKSSQAGNLILVIIAACLFGLIAWWFLFPTDFNQFVSNVYQQVDVVKNKMSQPGIPTQASSSSQLSSNSSMGSSGDQSKLNSTTSPVQTVQHGTAAVEPSGIINDDSERPVAHLVKSRQLDSDNVQAGPLTGQAIQLPAKDDKSVDALQLKTHKAWSKKNVASMDPVVPIEGETIYPLQSNGNKQKNVQQLPDEPVIIRFKYNNNEISEKGLVRLKGFADTLMRYPDIGVEVTGYTDAQGNEAYNKKLSLFRANIVKTFLLGRGVPESHIEVKGMGSVNPVEENTTAWGRMMNRRVEIKVLKRLEIKKLKPVDISG